MTQTTQQSTIVSKLEQFVQLLFTWSKVHNLTAWTDMQSTVTSLQSSGIATSAYLHGPVIDLGTGAGIPGVVLAILNPNLQFTLIDSRHKKIAFVRHACEQLGLHNVTTLAIRAENVTSDAHIQCYRTLVCRAFGGVEHIIHTAKHLLAPGARLVLERSKYELPIQLMTPFVHTYYVPLSPPATGKLLIIQT